MLSLISMSIMVILTVTLLFHWSLPPVYEMLVLLILSPMLLILSPWILYLRAKSFRGIQKKKLEEQKRLVMEVQEMVDEQKRRHIREGKIARGEDVGVEQ